MHAESPSARIRVFVELNCAAIPEDYIESELFGYRNGAMPVSAGAPLEKHAAPSNAPTAERSFSTRSAT